MLKVLILTNREDAHANAIAECLIRKGGIPFRWFPEEFLLNQKATQRITLDGKHSIEIDSENIIDLIEVDVVWHRRPQPPRLPKQLEPLDQQFIETENRIHMKSLLLTLGESAKWINPLSSIDKSNSKALQLREAARLELNIPETLITNDKKTIVEFISKNLPDGTIYKTFSPAIWEENNEIFSCYTTAITTTMLVDEANMALTPGIYQKIVNKSFEVRVTFFGSEYIAVKISNSEVLDWRILSSASGLRLSPFLIPLEIETKCKLLMKKLGIVFGCFDFIVTPTNEYVFLEVNEMGQFLWIEKLLPELRLMDKFCEFLLSP